MVTAAEKKLAKNVTDLNLAPASNLDNKSDSDVCIIFEHNVKFSYIKVLNKNNFCIFKSSKLFALFLTFSLKCVTVPRQ
jgi:hypothetical protein